MFKRYKQSNGTIVEAEFTADGRQVKINNGEVIIWAPVDLETLDMPQDSYADKQAKRASHAAAKAQYEREVAYDKVDTHGILWDKRNGTITCEQPIQPASIEIIDLVENPKRRR